MYIKHTRLHSAPSNALVRKVHCHSRATQSYWSVAANILPQPVSRHKYTAGPSVYQSGTSWADKHLLVRYKGCLCVEMLKAKDLSPNLRGTLEAYMTQALLATHHNPSTPVCRRDAV